jgi:hypothetical protein
MNISGMIANRIKDKPAWIGMFMVLAIASISILALSYSARTHQMSSLLPSSATMQERATAEQLLMDEEITRCAFLPVRLFTGWLSFTLVLYYTCFAFAPAQRIRVKQMFSLEIHAEIILVLGSLISALISLASTPEIGKVAAMPLSARTFYKGDSGLMILFLNSINVFQLLYVCFLMYGVRLITGFGRVKSVFIVFMVWAICIFSNIAMIKFVQERMHLNF